jgi:hypothetical protein
MLNPYSIEKELLQKTEYIKELLSKLKKHIACSVIKKANAGTNIDVEFYLACLELQQSGIILKKNYVCKICGRKFDDGRKLGGHVSRAHKDGESSISFMEEEIS